MNMPIVDLTLFEALTEAGVKPDAARRVERKVESAITQGQDAVRAEMQAQLMTKADGLLIKQDVVNLRSELKQDIADLRGEIHKALNEQTWKLVTFVVAANGVMLAALKYLG